MITTNTGAKKLESSDNWREIFPNPGTGTAGAHNASVDAQDRIQAEVAPIINGKQCALGASSGDYVLLRNSTITGKSDGAYIATKAIPANTDIDSTYLGNAITGGISNSLNNNLATKFSGALHYYTHQNVSYDANGIGWVAPPTFPEGNAFPFLINCADAIWRVVAGRNWNNDTIIYAPAKANQTDAALTIHYIVGWE